MNPQEPLNQPEEPLQPAELQQYAEVEAYLTLALRPVIPPDDFADHILARARPVRSTPAKVIRMTHRTRLWAGGAIAASLLAGIFVAEQTHARHQRQKVELAQQQFEAAIQITNETLEQTRQQLRQAGIEIGN